MDEPLHLMTWEQMSSCMRNLHNSLPTSTDIQQIGITSEGRPLEKLKIDFSRAANTSCNVVLTSGFHAKESLAHATVLWLAYQMVHSTSNDIDILRSKCSWHIYPNMNPDGYSYAATHDRLWRKNRRSYHPNERCCGVDLNRNWDHTSGTGTLDPCSEVYSGPYPFSEQETFALKKDLLSIGEHINLVFDVHAYGQLILHTDNASINEFLLGNEMAKAAEIINGNKFRSSNIFNSLSYSANGTFFEWASESLGVPFSFVFEVQPHRDNFWTDSSASENLTASSGKELLAALKTAMLWIDKTEEI